MFPIVEDAVNNTIQSRATSGVSSGFPLLLGLSSGSGLIPPWWSASRDIALQAFWKRSDHFSGAHYNMIAKMTAIPFSAVPRDYTNVAQAEEAEEETLRVLDGAEFGEGWIAFYSKVLDHMLATDNGWFAEIIGNGDPTGPIVGQPITVAHLDSARCIRTGDPIYPVLYQDNKGKVYKLHYSRVMFGSQMPSGTAEMNGVGFCAVSRAIMTAQNLIDIAVYKMEKLGSRPHRELIITRGGLDPEDLRSAFAMANESNDSQGFSRYSRIVVTGHSAMPDADVKQVTFTTLPDGFDEKTSVTLGMAVIAMAYGVDARDLFPAMESGATRADALLQHLKQRGKGPGQIISDIEAQFNRKYYPRYMKMVFDFQDDAEDMQVAEIKHMRAQRRERDLANGAIDTRVAREQMIADSDLTRKQFEELELRDGRLENGTPVIALFHSTESKYKNLLTLSDVDDPLDVTANDPAYMVTKINEAIVKVDEGLLNTTAEGQRKVYQRAAAALNQLMQLYYVSQTDVSAEDEGSTAPRLYPTRRENLMYPNQRVELNTGLSTLPGKDDKETDLDSKMAQIFQLMNSLKSVTDTPEEPSYNIVESDEAEQPIINVQLPESSPQRLTVMFPKEMAEDLIPIVNVQMPDQERPVIEVDIPEQKVVKRTSEAQRVQRDAAGNMVGTLAEEVYEYAES